MTNAWHVETKNRRILQAGQVVFTSRSSTLFQLLICLYIKKCEAFDGQGWVGLQELRALGLASTSHNHSLGTVLARCIERLHKSALPLVDCPTTTRGPYCLNVPLEQITFDISLTEARQSLPQELVSSAHCTSLAEMHRFTRAIVDGDVAFFGVGDHTQALACYQQAREQMRHILLKSVLMLRICDVWYRLGKQPEAQQELESILVWITEGKLMDAHLVARAHVLAARLLYRQGQYHELAQKLSLMKKVVPLCADTTTLADYLELQGLLSRERALQAVLHGATLAQAEDQAEKAMVFFRQALYLRVRGGDHNGARNTCINIANTLYKLGNEPTYALSYGQDVEEIKDWIDLSEHIRTEWISGRDTVLHKILLASVLRRREQDDVTAEKIIQEAYREAQQIGNVYDQGILLRQLAGNALRRGEKQAARGYLQDAIALLVSTGAMEAVAHIKADFPDMSWP